MSRITELLNERGPARTLRAAINDLRRDVKALRIAQGVGYLVKHTSLGQVLEIKSVVNKSESNDIKVVRISTVEEDSLTCFGLLSDHTPSTVVYHVAKPIWLRYPYAYGEGVVSNLEWDENPATHQKVTYTFNTGYSITERIKPYYSAGDLLYIVRLMGENLRDANDDWIKWMDLNVDGRNWFIEPREFTICDNTTGTPVEKTALIAGTEGV